MNRYSKPGTDGWKRIKSNARKPARHRHNHLFFFSIASLLAILVTSNDYSVLHEVSGASELIPPAGVAGTLGEPLAQDGTQIPADTQSPGKTPVFAPTSTWVPTLSIPTLTHLPSPTPTLLSEPPVVIGNSPTSQPPILYYTQAGDTLPAVSSRFNVQPGEITSPDPIPETSLLSPGQLLVIPHRLGETSPDTPLIPDSEIVFSPTAVDFKVADYIEEAGGYLSLFKEYLGTTGWTTGVDIINRVALENSVNPRILIALLEYQAHWIFGNPTNLAETYYPLGIHDLDHKDLYSQLNWALDKLSTGYYSWRDGRLTELVFPNGEKLRIAPQLNAGSVALQYLFSLLYNRREWESVLYASDGFSSLYEKMFGSPWLRAQSVEPLFPTTLTQPGLILPFIRGQLWSLTGGPHAAWNSEGAWAALDFAPGSTESGCVKSESWVTSAATGLVTRSDRGVVVIDLDGDGHEQTGWVIMYLHIATAGRIPVGAWVEAGDLLGHPSCEGGLATGTHVHIARKYNGEWILADGPIPFTLSGWVAHAADAPYKGTLTKGDQTVTACTCGSYETRITRLDEDQ